MCLETKLIIMSIFQSMKEYTVFCVYCSKGAPKFHYATLHRSCRFTPDYCDMYWPLADQRNGNCQCINSAEQSLQTIKR